MGFGPTGYFSNGTFIPFEKLDNLQRNAYERKTSDIMKQLRTPREVNDTVLRQYLLQASALGMLYTPDGKAVSQADVAKMSENSETMFGLAADLIVVKPDIDNPNKNQYYPLQALNKKISIDRSDADGLYPSDLRRRQRTYLEKKQCTAQAEKISAMAAPDRAKYLEDAKAALAKWSENGIEVGSPALKELLESAVEMGIVREVSGSTLTKETAAKIAERPAYLKNLVFIQQSEKDAREFDTYRLDLSDGEPQTVKMHPRKLASADIVQMDKEMEARGPREKAPSDLAAALASDDEKSIAKHEKQMRDFGYKFEYIEGIQAFRLTDENKLYLAGYSKPINTPDELMAKLRGVAAPKKPNRWGAFKGLREFWHNHISKLPDYTEYDKEKAVYELDKYHLAEKAGFDVSGLTAKKNEYESKHGDLYNQYQDASKYKEACRIMQWSPKVDEWANAFDVSEMSEEQERFFEDFKTAVKQHPDLGEKIIKHFSNHDQETFDKILSVAEPYAGLSQGGAFSKKNLGSLSALGVAAEWDLFPKALKNQTLSECKHLSKDFAAAYDKPDLPDDSKTAKPTDEKKEETVIKEEQASPVNLTAEQKQELAEQISELNEKERAALEKLAADRGVDLSEYDKIQSNADNTEKTVEEPQASSGMAPV